MIYDELLDRLKRLDEDANLLFDDDRRLRLTIVGGSALILLEVIDRATLDIDAMQASSEILELLERYDINCRVQTYINNFPYNFEDRLVKLPINGKKIDFYSASLEDIVIAKLFSIRDTDRQDVLNPNVINSIDWELLDRLALNSNELKSSVLNEKDYEEFLINYKEYKRRYGK